MKSFLLKISLCVFTSPLCFNLLAYELVVSDTKELKAAIKLANSNTTEESITIVLESGQYKYANNLLLTRPGITLRSRTSDPSQVVLSGNGMLKSNTVELIFDVQASNINIIGLTLKDVSHHLIQVRAEKAVRFFRLENCILQDSYQQLLKVSGNNNDKFSDFGTIRNNRFKYTAGVGPNYYIGGIDAHKSRNWEVSHNIFLNIASPAKKVAEHAIHFWRKSSDIAVTHNTIINSDRGIGFGLGNNKGQSKGGIIANNKIIHDNNNHNFADVGISLESSPDTIVANNDIFLNSSYPNAIEYRFQSTQNVIIRENVTNKSIVSRDGADAILIDNISANTPEKYWNFALYYIKQVLRFILND